MNRILVASFYLVCIFWLSSGCGKEDPTTLRGKAIRDYNDHYLGSHVSDPVWTGSVTGCLEGTISSEARSKVLQRLNYFRRMVGLSDNLTENTLQHSACQKASLMFKAHDDVSHYPTPDWACYTPEGADAAATSNIAWGTATSGEWSVHSADGITGFIEEPGSNNTRAGHRAWFFLPGLNRIGIGSTNTTCCMQWKDNYGTSGVYPAFIAYPPAGYVPNTLVFLRWSFSVPGGNAGYQDASVTMTDEDGQPVTVNVMNKPAATPGKAVLPQLVWDPVISVSNIRKDKKFNVTINNVTGAPKTTYQYTVIAVPVASPQKRLAPGIWDDRRLGSGTN